MPRAGMAAEGWGRRLMPLDLNDVEAARRSGVALDAISAAQRQHAREHRRPAALTAREALAALEFEALLVLVAAGNLRNGEPLCDDDFERLALAQRRIQTLVDEVNR